MHNITVPRILRQGLQAKRALQQIRWAQLGHVASQRMAQHYSCAEAVLTSAVANPEVKLLLKYSMLMDN